PSRALHSFPTRRSSDLIIGAGQMGGGIAQVCAVAGLAVTMIDVTDAILERGVATLSGSLDRLVKKEKLTAVDKAAALGRVKTTTDRKSTRLNSSHGSIP